MWPWPFCEIKYIRYLLESISIHTDSINRNDTDFRSPIKKIIVKKNRNIGSNNLRPANYHSFFRDWSRLFKVIQTKRPTPISNASLSISK